VSDCLFCRIVAGEIPSEEVASSERTYAFRDIKPALPVHVLVVPREHIVSADTVQPEHGDLLAEMMDTAQRVARTEGLSERGYRLVFNVGEDAQNSVAHLHMHLVGGRPMGWPPG
jgi:histidine triad (HIT) family protein